MNPLQLPVKKFFFFATAVSGLITVAIGAFGAHVLKDTLTDELMEIFQTGLRYQMFQTVSLGLVAYLDEKYFHKWIFNAGWFFIYGTIIFSGSLYTLALTGIRIWGAVTPIGGILLLIGWIILILGSLKN